jgi:hypothetical protein
MPTNTLMELFTSCVAETPMSQIFTLVQQHHSGHGKWRIRCVVIHHITEPIISQNIPL